MKSKLLLPKRFRILGMLILLPSAVLGFLYLYQDFTFAFLEVNDAESSFLDGKNYNLTDEIALTGVIVGLLMIAFTRIKNEDEFIHFIRLESWQWAVLVNFFLLLLAIWFVYGDTFFQVMIYNMLTIPLLFIFRFYILLYRFRKSAAQTAHV